MTGQHSALDGLYQQLILDHAREKHGRGLRAPVAGATTGESHQVNPLCGDEVTLRVAVVPAAAPVGGDVVDVVVGVVGDPLVRVVGDLSWEGEGCSISQAATSVLHDLVVGLPVDAAGAVVAAYREMVRSRGSIDPDEDVLGDAVAFVGVGRHANRVKCAMLGWTAFEDALLRAGAILVADTEGSTR